MALAFGGSRSELGSRRSTVTNREQILKTLGVASVPLDDDELSQRAGVAPRQAVNQICNALAAEKLITREPGRYGKLVNSIAPAHRDQTAEEAGLADSAPEVSTTVLSQPEVSEAPGGSSIEQRDAEAVMLLSLGQRLGVKLAPRRFIHPSGARVEVDGADADVTVLVECWAHQGSAKTAQKYKLVNDAVKLNWIARSLDPAPLRLIICVSDVAAISHLKGKSWHAHAIAELGATFEVVELPEDLVAGITAAQIRQFR